MTPSELDDSDSDWDGSDSNSSVSIINVVKNPLLNPQPQNPYERQRLANIERNKALLINVQEAYMDLMNDMNIIKKTKKVCHFLMHIGVSSNPIL